MKKIDNIKSKIEQVLEILCNIKTELEQLSEETEKIKGSVPKQIVPSDKELKSEFENLYLEFLKPNVEAIKDFIKNKDKSYLKAFCKANSLPVDTSKNSKEKITDEVLKWMSQRKAITK